MRSKKRSSATPHTDQLEELRVNAAQAHQRAREIEGEQRRVQDEIGRLRESRVEAFAAGNESDAERLQRETSKAQATASDLADRREGAKRAAQRLAQATDRYVVEHYAGLAAERAPTDRAAAEDVEKALQVLLDAVGRWHHASAANTQLLRPIDGRDGREIPQLTADSLTRDVKHLLRDGIPLPVPRATSMARIAPEHDPDPAVREAARERIWRSEPKAMEVLK